MKRREQDNDTDQPEYGKNCALELLVSLTVTTLETPNLTKAVPEKVLGGCLRFRIDLQETFFPRVFSVSMRSA